jgi:hypothetical protein
MQYILSEEEMESVRSDRAALKELLSSLPSKDQLQQMCTKIANEWPTFTGWDKKDPRPATPWGCILTEEYEHYCDKCPVLTICPNKNKSWSK